MGSAYVVLARHHCKRVASIPSTLLLILVLFSSRGAASTYDATVTCPLWLDRKDVGIGDCSSEQQHQAIDHPIEWFRNAGNILDQTQEFYQSVEAVLIAENVLAYQSANGGGRKNYDRILDLDNATLAGLYATKVELAEQSIIDNDATVTEIRFLARLERQHQRNSPYQQAIQDGIQYLLDAEYQDSGGWPQYFPNTTGYHRYITFNDNAMVGVLDLFHDLISANEQSLEDFSSIPPVQQEQTAQALERGVQLVLDLQIRVNDPACHNVAVVRTAWCAQYHHETLQPAQARSYEPPSISGSESVGIVQFLMSLSDPSTDVILAIESAMAWLEEALIPNQLLECFQNSDGVDDRRLIPSRGEDMEFPIWARFYSLNESATPIFQDRDGSTYKSYNKLSFERRMGYNYVTALPNELFCQDYPNWTARLLSINSTATPSAAATISLGAGLSPVTTAEKGNISGNCTPVPDTPPSTSSVHSLNRWQLLRAVLVSILSFGVF